MSLEFQERAVCTCDLLRTETNWEECPACKTYRKLHSKSVVSENGTVHTLSPKPQGRARGQFNRFRTQSDVEKYLREWQEQNNKEGYIPNIENGLSEGLPSYRIIYRLFGDCKNYYTVCMEWGILSTELGEEYIRRVRNRNRKITA
jgi:hypothetical protein